MIVDVPTTKLPAAAAINAGKSSQIFFVPADQLTAELELLLERIVVRASVLPPLAYVPFPTSQLVPSVAA